MAEPRKRKRSRFQFLQEVLNAFQMSVVHANLTQGWFTLPLLLYHSAADSVARICRGDRQNRLVVVFVRLENAQTEPAPIYAIALNKPFTIQFHNLHRVHLFTIGRAVRILPHQGASICEVPCAVPCAD